VTVIEEEQNEGEEEYDYFGSIDYSKGYYSDSAADAVRRFKIEKKQSVTIDDFKFLEFIGKGAYGRIYLVEKR